MEFLIVIALIGAGFYLYAFVIEPKIRENRNFKNNWLQYAIYEQAVNKILEAMVKHEESAENTLLLLNAIVDTYNESLRGDTTEAMMAPRFEEPTYDTTRRQSDTTRRHPGSEGQEPEGQKPRRTARKRVDSSASTGSNADSGSIEE